jgi:hypothetical protein
MESRRLLSLLLYASPSKPSFFSLSPHLLLADPCSFFPLSRSPFLSFDVSACSVVRSNPSTPYPFEWVRPKVRRLHLPNRPGPYLSSFCRSSCCFGWLVVRGRTKNGYRRGDGAVCWRVGCSAGRSGCAALDEKTRKAERLACIERQARCVVRTILVFLFLLHVRLLFIRLLFINSLVLLVCATSSSNALLFPGWA